MDPSNIKDGITYLDEKKGELNQLKASQDIKYGL